MADRYAELGLIAALAEDADEPEVPDTQTRIRWLSEAVVQLCEEVEKLHRELERRINERSVS